MTSIYHIEIPKSNADVWAKLESENPTGTHKDRSMRRWISHYVNRGAREFVISSSGNSAISAAKFCKEAGIKLNVFVSPNIAKNKISISRIRSYKNVVLNFTKTPNKDSFRFSKKNNVVNLRSSKDDISLEGYKDIARELVEQLPNTNNIFVPTSSGATLEGIYLGYKALASVDATASRQNTGTKTQMPAFFVVQTTKVHPIASYFDKDFVPEKTSCASAIVDNVAHRRDGVIKIIQETGGGGFVISNKELERAKEILGESNFIWADPIAAGPDPDSLRFGWHSALAFAGFLKRKKQNSKIAKNVISVCIFTD